MPIVSLDNVADPRLADYRGVSEPALLRSRNLFIAEGRQVVRALLGQSRYGVESIVVTARVLDTLAGALAARNDEVPVYLVPEGAIEALSGYNITRGCLALGVRPDRPSVGTWLSSRPAGRGGIVVAVERMANADNMGGIFRNAAAFGVEAVLVGPACCDPLYRKAIRVSMGAALRVPCLWAEAWPGALHELRDAGFLVAALTPARGARSIDTFAAEIDLHRPLALVAGNEGDGLSPEAVAASDVAVRIPMAEGFDSLNVATATGIALHRLARIGEPGA